MEPSNSVIARLVIAGFTSTVGWPLSTHMEAHNCFLRY